MKRIRKIYEMLEESKDTITQEEQSQIDTLES